MIKTPQEIDARELAYSLGAVSHTRGPLRAVAGVSLTFAQLAALVEVIQKAERDRCAATCEHMKSDAWANEAVARAHNTAASNCAAAIRALREE